MAKYFDIRKLKFRMKKKIRLFLDDVASNNPQAVSNLCGGRDFKFENVWLMANGHVGVVGYTWVRANNIISSYTSHIFNHKVMVPDDYGNCAKGAPYSIKNSRLFHLWSSTYANHLITGVDKKNNIWYDAICHSNNSAQQRYYACNIKKVSTTNFATTAKGQLTYMTAQHYSVIWDSGKNGAKDHYAFNKNPFNLRQGTYISNAIGLSAGDAFNAERTNGVYGFTATPENPTSAAYYTTNSRIIRRCGITILLEMQSKRMRIWRDSDLRKRVTNIHKNYNFGTLYNTVSGCNFNHQEWAMNDDRWFMFGTRESHPSHFIMGKLKPIEEMFASGNNNVWEVAPKLIPIRDCLLPEQRTLNPTYYCQLMKDFTDTGLSVFNFNKAAGTVYGAIGIGIVNDNGKCEIRYITANELGITESFVDNLMGDLSEDGKELVVIHNPGNNGPEGESLLWIFDVIYEDDDITTHETLNGGGGNKWKIKLTLFLVFLLLIRRKYMRT